jgi:hypothetical protein
MDHEETKLHDLYPGLPEEERRQAVENLKRYAKLVIKIYGRLSKEEHATIAARREWEKRFKGKNSAS